MENLIKWFPSLAPVFNSLPFAFVLLVVGFVLLIKGADFFVDGSSGIAKKLRIPSIIIGLTVVAMGTSLPEAAVSVSAGLKGSNSLAISNVLGSNFFNLMVVVGMCAVMSPIVVQKDVVKRDIPISIGAAIMLLVLGGIGMTLGRIDAIILLVLFVIFIVSLVLLALKARRESDEPDEDEDEKIRPIWLCLIFIVGGAIAIMIGGDAVVDSATNIATAFGMSETLIGLTIVAVGTSLPELVTSMVAAKKGESDLALGNVIGSNVFNIVFILGASAVLSPMTVDILSVYDTLVLLFVSVLTLVFAKTSKRFSRAEGAVMIAIYAIYFVYVLLR